MVYFVQVYEEVTSLFHSAPDLLEEFKQFLPADGQSAPQASHASRSNRTKSNHGGARKKTSSSQQHMQIDDEETGKKRQRSQQVERVKEKDSTNVRRNGKTVVKTEVVEIVESPSVSHSFLFINVHRYRLFFF
jgi:histone deacetylase complex regulatory component SIN3